MSGFLLIAIALLTSARSSRAAFVPAGGSCTTFTCASWPWGSAEGIATSPDGVFVYTMVGLRIYVRDGARQVTTWRTAAAAGDAGSSGGLATDASGFVYVVDDTNHALEKFTASGTLVAQVALPSSKVASALAVGGGTAYVVVADLDSATVMMFATSTLTPTGSFSRQGTGPGQIMGPTALTVAPSGSVHLADQFPVFPDPPDGSFQIVGRLEEFDASGTFRGEWSFSPDVTALAADADGDLLIGERETGNVYHASRDGTHPVLLPRTWGSGWPTAIAVDSTGAAWVAINNGLFTKYRQDGKPEFSLAPGEPTSGPTRRNVGYEGRGWSASGGPIVVRWGDDVVATIGATKNFGGSFDLVDFPTKSRTACSGQLTATQGELSVSVGLTGTPREKLNYAKGVTWPDGRPVRKGSIVCDGLDLVESKSHVKVVESLTGAWLGLRIDAGRVQIDSGVSARKIVLGAGGPKPVTVAAKRDPDVRRFDPQGEPGVITLSEGRHDSLNLDTFYRRQGNLRADEGIVLENALLFVDGDLRVTGGVKGTGAIFVLGNATISGRVDLQPFGEGDLKHSLNVGGALKFVK